MKTADARFARHQRLMGQYLEIGEADRDVLLAHHRFVRDEDNDTALARSSWGAQMAIKYYRRLFKEYALADLSRYREGKIGLRWRAEREVVSGKGQFECANTNACDARGRLRSFEVNVAYVEDGERRNELVKVSHGEHERPLLLVR